MKITLSLLLILVSFIVPAAMAQEGDHAGTQEVRSALEERGFDNVIFDDNMLINGYAAKISQASKELLLAMINDDFLAGYRKAAALRVFREKFSDQIVSRERTIVERMLLRQLERSASSFVQVELMHTLLTLDRYRYFVGMMPALIRKMDHYDQTVSDLAYKSIVNINQQGTQRSREARIVFNTLRKMFFLTRKKLGEPSSGNVRLSNKLDLLRWSIKVLGTDHLQNLPKEVIALL